MASVLMKHDKAGSMLRLYNKGAAEWVIKRCKALMNEDGSLTPLSEEKASEMLDTITNMAKRVSGAFWGE
jgi:P-type Ca2+ transporter type 2C